MIGEIDEYAGTKSAKMCMDKQWKSKKHGKNARHGIANKKASMEKREDEATDGDGVVTMKTHEKKINGAFCM